MSSAITCRRSKRRRDAMLTVINDILDFSKIEAGKLDLEPVQFSFLECIGEALKAISAQRPRERPWNFSSIPNSKTRWWLGTRTGYVRSF